MADVTKTTLIKVEVEGIAQATEQTKKLTTEIDKQETSIAKLREENKRLTKERNEVNINSEEGRAKLKELNDQLDSNNKKIKENVDQYTKQKIGVGDYKGALDKLVPGLGATADGFSNMTSTAKAFIATPLGAVVGALGIAIGALISYFKNTGSGQDALAEKTAILRLAFEKLMRGVEAVGKVVFQSIEFIAGAAERLISFISPAAGQAIEEAKKAGGAIAKLDDAIDEKETELIKRRASTNLAVARLREEALRQEGAEKEATIQRAIELEKTLSAEEAALAKKRLELFQREKQGKQDLTDEEKRQMAELVAAVTDAEAQKYEATLRFQKEIEKLREEAHKNELARIAERQAAEHAVSEGSLIQETEIETKKVEVKGLLSDKSFAKMKADVDKSLKVNIDANKKEQEAANKAQKDQTRITELENKNRLMLTATTISMAAELFEKDTVAYKFLSAARATIDTFAAATEVLPNFILAAVVTGIGLTNVAKILGVGFAEGGFTGEGGRLEPAGIVHRGEYVVPQHIVKNPVYSGYISTLESARTRGYADGGLVTNTATADSNQIQMMSEMMSKIQIFTSLTELERAQNSRMAKVKMSEI